MRLVAPELILFAGMLLQQSIDFVIIHKKQNIFDFGPLNIFSLTNSEFLIAMLILIILTTAISIGLRFLYRVQSFWFEVLQLFNLPIAIIISALLIKRSVDYNSHLNLLGILALIFVTFYQFLKIISFSNRNDAQTGYNYAKAIPYFHYLLILKMLILALGPLLIESDLAVGFALVIHVLKTVLFVFKINMQEANMEFVIGISLLWGWFSFLKYIMIMTQINSIFINIGIIVCIYLVISKPQFLIIFFQLKYRFLFEQSKDSDRANDIPRASIIVREFYSMQGDRPIQWSKHFTLVIRQYVYDKEIKDERINLQKTKQIEAIKISSYQNPKESFQKIDLITKLLWDFFIHSNRFYMEDYFYVGTYLCYVFPTKESDTMLNKLFNLFYTMKFCQKQISFIEKMQLQFCFLYLESKLVRQSSFKKYFYMEDLIMEVQDLIYGFYKNQEKYFHLLSFNDVDHLEIKDYLLEKNRIRNQINQKMDEYRITQAKSNMCLIIEYILECFFNRNSNKAKQFLADELKKKSKGRSHGLLKSYLTGGQTMIALISAIRNTGKILYSNNVFKEQLQVKQEKFGKFSYKSYNIHDFMPEFYREKHQTALSNFEYDQFPAHALQVSYIVGAKGKMLNVKIKMRFYFDFLDDLKVFIDMRIQQEKSYAFYNEDHQIVFLSKELGNKQDFKRQFLNGNLPHRHQSICRGVTLFQDSIYRANTMDIKDLRSFSRQQSDNAGKNRIVQIFQKIYFVQKINIEAPKADPKFKWLRILRKQGQSTNFAFNLFQIKKVYSPFQEINMKKEDSFYKCRQKVSFLSPKLFNLVLVLVVILVGCMTYFLFTSLRNKQILDQKTELMETLNIFQTKYQTNQIFNSLDFAIKCEYMELQKYQPQLLSQYSFVPRLIKESTEQNINNFNAIENRFFTGSITLDLIFRQTLYKNSIFKEVVSFYGYYLQSIPSLMNQIPFQQLKEVSKTIFYKTQESYASLFKTNTIKQIGQQLSDQLDQAFSLKIKVIYFAFISILSVFYFIYVFIYYNLRKSVNQLLQLPLNVNIQTFKSLYIEAQMLIDVLKLISRTSQSKLVRELQQSSIKIDDKIIRQSQTLCTMNSKKEIKLPLSEEVKCFTIITFICLACVIAGIVLHSMFVIGRIDALNQAYKNLQGLNKVSMDLTKSIKQLVYQKHQILMQNDHRKLLQKYMNQLNKNSDLAFIRNIFSKQKSEQILFKELCNENPQKWRCLNFMKQSKVQLKPSISNALSQIRFFQFNMFIPEHKFHGIAQELILSYQYTLMLKVLNDRVAQQAFRQLKIDNLNDFHLQKIIITCFGAFCLYSIFSIIILLFRIKIFQKEVFKLAKFQKLIHMEKYLYYVNYFYSHQIQIEEQ